MVHELDVRAMMIGKVRPVQTDDYNHEDKFWLG